MRTDGLFTVKQHAVKVKVGEPIWLRPFSDVHRDHELHADTEWQDWLRYTKDKTRRAIYIGLGDYLDFMRAHTRAVVDYSAIEHRQIADNLQKGAIEEVKHLASELRHLSKDLIGLMGGNHFMEFTDKKGKSGSSRIHSDEYLADTLGVEYLGTCCHLTLTLKDERKGAWADVRLILHHGAGGATTIGGSLSRVQRFKHGFAAEIALMGDDHKRGCAPIQDELGVEIVGGKPVMTATTQWVGRTGSFMRGFEPGKSSYVVDRAFSPTSIGTVEFELTLKKSERTGRHFVNIRGLQ